MGGTHLPSPWRTTALATSSCAAACPAEWAPPKTVSAPERDHQLEIAHRRVGAFAIGLVDREHVGALENPGLDRLHVVAHAGRHHDQRGVRGARDLELVLPDADRLDENDVGAPRVEHAHDVARRAREPAERAARRERSDEHPGIVDVALHADAIAENRAARKTGSSGSTATTATFASRARKTLDQADRPGCSCPSRDCR